MRPGWVPPPPAVRDRELDQARVTGAGRPASREQHVGDTGSDDADRPLLQPNCAHRPGQTSYAFDTSGTAHPATKPPPRFHNRFHPQRHSSTSQGDSSFAPLPPWLKDKKEEKDP